MTPLTPEQRRELVERPFTIRTVAGLNYAGPGVTRWQNGDVDTPRKREYAGAAFLIGRLLYGEEYYKW